MAVHYLLFLSVLFNTGYQCLSLEVELGHKNYTINFITRNGKNGDYVEILCQPKQVGGQNITWYFMHSHNLPELYPFQFCQKEKNCELDNGGRLLIVNQFNPSAGGSYICVDGENGQGYSIHFQECVPPKVQQLSFYNQTAPIGANVTFSCSADTGYPNCTTDVDYISFRFPARIGGERYKKSKLSNRIVDGRVIVSKNLTLMNIRKEDFGINVNCTMFAEIGPLEHIQSAWLLEQDSSTIEDTKVDIKIVLCILLPVGVVIFIIVGIVCLYHPGISYVHLRLTHNLPKKGDKPFHGLILYNEGAEVYDKVQQLKSGLHKYNLREYPPGPDSMDQQAGYSLPALLDTMCQECACVIIVGEVGDLEERCLSTFKGREVTHIILSGSLDKKKINPVLWPKETSCNWDRKWRNFIFGVKKGLPKQERRGSKDPEEQMLTSV